MARLLALLLAGVLLLTQPGTADANSGINWRTNRFRENHNREALRVSDRLEYFARVRARQIVTEWGHQFWWVGRAGCSWGGENIAWVRPSQENNPRWFVEAWKDSPAHREVMLGRTWDRMGSAIFYGPAGRVYAVQLFCQN